MDMQMLAAKPKPQPLQCKKCVEKWKNGGRDPNTAPRKIGMDEVRKNDGNCPDCGSVFESYFGF
jgi:hypothetical protein